MADIAVTQAGFEYQGVFYPWHVTTTGKDLLLIDRISGMAPQEFFELIEDGYDLSRSAVTFSLMATSIRNRFPERSIERIVRAVEAIDLDEVEFMGGDDEEGEDGPPAQAGASPPADQSATSSDTSKISADTISEPLQGIPA